VAERDADTKQAEVEVTKTTLADAVKADYLQLAYLQQTLGILRQNKAVLDQLIQDATAHCQVGQGMQEDVLQAQVNQTKIVKEITIHHQLMGQTQAHLKALLSRDQGSPDIVTEDLIETPLKRASDELLVAARLNNPQIQVDASTIRKQDAQLASAKREGKPDFEVGYMYQNTDRKYRDYYMFTFDVRFPRKARVNAEIAEATERRSESQQALNAHLQQQLAEVHAGYVKAYIRKVFANATYEYVRKGEPLFTIYSPDLVATQQEYLLARQNQKALSASTVDGVATGAGSLSAAAEQRLEQWEVPRSEIAKLKETGKPVTDLTINSPVTGYITERNALPNMYAQPSSKLYTVADLSRVWVYAQIFQNDVGRVKPGDTAQITVDSYPGRTFSDQIEEILPQVDMATRTVRVRLAMANPGLKLKPGMFVNVDLKTSLGRQLIVPASAVFQSGTRQLVFLNHGNGSLEPKEITVGPRVGDDFVVLKGLEAHQSIATSANFLIDSESQLQAAAGSFTPPPPGAGSNAPVANAPTVAKVNVDFTTDPNPPQKGSNIFRVKLTNADGSPTTGAEVTATCYMAAMPAMGMAAMNTAARLTEKGNGMYEGSGSLGSGGTWQVTISVQKKRSSDRCKAIARERDRRHVMLSRIIEICARNPFMVFTAVLLLTLAGIWSLQHVPLDALPDISDVQVVVHTSWAGESPDVIEDQVTYPIVTSLLAAPHVKAACAQTMFHEPRQSPAGTRS